MQVESGQNRIFQHICQECGGQIIQNSHESVCEICGLIHDDKTYVSNYQFNEIKETDFSNPDQFVSIGKVVDNVCTLGTHIGYFSTRTFMDYKGKLISPNNQRLFSKLKNQYTLPIKIKNHETDYRILKILNDISQYMNLSPLVKNRAAYIYQKIKKISKHIRNHVSLIGFCIFHAVREYSQNAPVSVKELSKIFQLMGHRINPRLIIRDSLDYQNIFKTKEFPHKSEDYIVRLVNSVVNFPELDDRMGKKKNDWTKEEYQLKLLSMCSYILQELSPKIRSSRNPFILAGAIVYCADKMIAKNYGTKSLLTQEIASESMGIPEYSIRDHYVKILKPFFEL
jgi:transcription initiation factor TFIIIB Brf1 subunit/transcription initiation factor TFIIB